MENKAKSVDLMDKIVSLCKRRGFVFPGSEIYGGLANSWDFGPYGVELKNNIKKHWWKTFVQEREDMVGLDSAIIMNSKVWEASGHLANFSDPLIECKECHNRFRADQIPGIEVKIKPGGMGVSWKISGDVKCEVCGKSNFAEPAIFNLMMETGIGPVHLGALYFQAGEFEKSGEKDKKKEIISKINKAAAYLRPETAQGIFVNFKNIIDSNGVKMPFGVAQIGKAFRNEITPGNFIFRTREFEQMEIEYFFNPEKTNWEEKFDKWLEDFKVWMDEIGVDSKKLFFHDIEKEELAHYSKKTIDVEFDFPFGKKELFGLAYRTDFDLKNHKLNYKDLETKEEFIPHVIEPSLGVERMALAVMLSVYNEEEAATTDGKRETRTVMKFPKILAPIKVAILPLSKKDELIEVSKEIWKNLRPLFMTEHHTSGSIGKRYRRQDEIGTPYCVTVDFETLEDKAVTVRDRDTMQQERIKIEDLKKYLSEKLS